MYGVDINIYIAYNKIVSNINELLHYTIKFNTQYNEMDGA